MRPSTLACALLLAVSVVGCRDKPAPTERSTTSAAMTTADFTVVTLSKSTLAGRPLATVLGEEAKKAKAQGKKPFAEVGATWCPPCKKIEASMGDARMADAFKGTYQVKLDADEMDSELKATGLKSTAIPVFFELGEDGKPTGRKIDGGAWTDDVPENMAPPLKKFFRGA